MIFQDLGRKKLFSKRLILLPFHIDLCRNILKNDFSDLNTLNLIKGFGWPDIGVIKNLPNIINKLSRVDYPTGFESWMVIKKDTREIIGDVGFKGYNFVEKSCDIGYGIIKKERKKGYAIEANMLLIDWAFSNDFVEKITACCLLSNLDSINLLKKLNFKEIDRDSNVIYWALWKS